MSVAIGVLRQMLADDLEATCRAVLGEVRVERHELRGTDGAGNRWIVALSGAKRGLCFNATAGGGGNVFDMIQRAAAGGDLRRACRVAEGLLGLAGAEPVELRRRAQDAAERRRLAREDEDRARAQRVEDLARRAAEYADGEPVRLDNPAGRYLAGRRCFPAEPGVLRSTRHRSPSGAAREFCLLAPLVTRWGGAPVAWHETRLEADERGGWRKVRGGVHSAKMVWGPAAGAFVQLGGELPGATTVLIAEGIENGLTAAALWPDLPAIAAYAVGNLAALALPEHVRRIVLVRDLERNPRSHGPRARAAALGKWWSEGRAVTVLDPPDGAADLNEAAQLHGLQAALPALAWRELWAAASPVSWDTVAGGWCAERHPELPELARAHPIAGFPAVLALLVGPDGQPQGMAARLVGAPLACAVSWGERAGTVLALRHPPSAGPVRLGVGWDAALSAAAPYGAIGLDHLAEATLSRRVWTAALIAPPAEREDDAALWREGIRRLHDGRYLMMIGSAPHGESRAA